MAASSLFNTRFGPKQAASIAQSLKAHQLRSLVHALDIINPALQKLHPMLPLFVQAAALQASSSQADPEDGDEDTSDWQQEGDRGEEQQDAGADENPLASEWLLPV